MSHDELVALLRRQDDHLSAALHEMTRQRTAVREALTQLRVGRSAHVVAALLDERCPEWRGTCRRTS